LTAIICNVRPSIVLVDLSFSFKREDIGLDEKTTGSLCRHVLLRFSIAVPSASKSGAIVHVGNGNGVRAPTDESPMPIGQQPLVRQFIRFLNFPRRAQRQAQ